MSERGFQKCRPDPILASWHVNRDARDLKAAKVLLDELT
jgi:hypothetical protein